MENLSYAKIVCFFPANLSLIFIFKANKYFRIPNPITVDPTKAKTKIQIRMQGGQKIVQEFNSTHLVADLFMFIGSKVSKGPIKT